MFIAKKLNYIREVFWSKSCVILPLMALTTLGESMQIEQDIMCHIAKVTKASKTTITVTGVFAKS